MKKDTKDFIWLGLLILIIIVAGIYSYKSENQSYDITCQITKHQAITGLAEGGMVGQQCMQKYINYMNDVPCQNISQNVDFRVLCKDVPISDNSTLNNILKKG